MKPERSIIVNGHGDLGRGSWWEDSLSWHLAATLKSLAELELTVTSIQEAERRGFQKPNTLWISFFKQCADLANRAMMLRDTAVAHAVAQQMRKK